MSLVILRRRVRRNPWQEPTEPYTGSDGTRGCRVQRLRRSSRLEGVHRRRRRRRRFVNTCCPCTPGTGRPRTKDTVCRARHPYLRRRRSVPGNVCQSVRGPRTSGAPRPGSCAARAAGRPRPAANGWLCTASTPLRPRP